MGRVKENLQTFYICGWCQEKIFNLRTENFNIPCPECGWNHGTRKYRSTPSTFRLDLSRY